MPNIHVNYGYWEFWETYPGQKVTFDGENKLIIVNEGETLIDFQVDIYSGWKEWMLIRENAQFAQALTAVGGDPTVGGNFLGITYFLENGWKIRTWEGDHTLFLDGNVFSRDGSDPFVNTIGDHNIRITVERSNLVDLVSNTPLTSEQAAYLRELWLLKGLDVLNPLIVTKSSRTVGSEISQTISDSGEPSPDNTITVTRN